MYNTLRDGLRAYILKNHTKTPSPNYTKYSFCIIGYLKNSQLPFHLQLIKIAYKSSKNSFHAEIRILSRITS